MVEVRKHELYSVIMATILIFQKQTNSGQIKHLLLYQSLHGEEKALSKPLSSGLLMHGISFRKDFFNPPNDIFR